MKLIKEATAAAIVAGTVSGIALAHDGATGMVMQRMEAMKEIGESMKTIAAMVKDEASFDAAKVEASAASVAKHAKHIPHMFPEGSLDKPTEALPVIWTRWDDFTGLAQNMHTDAMALAEAAKTATSVKDIMPALANVGRSCKACHQDFRLAK